LGVQLRLNIILTYIVIYLDYLDYSDIIASAREIMANIMKLPSNENDYSDPKSYISLPFPYPDKKPIDRFDIDNDGFFTFMGRKEFINVLKTIYGFRPNGYMKLLVYGTVGYGKSHILSAITCFLLRTGNRVVYLPDCRQLAMDPVDYVKSALFLAYHDDDKRINEISSCIEFVDIVNYCKSLKMVYKERLYFIVDQMNALDENDETGIPQRIKEEIKRGIDQMANHHYYIISSSANNKSISHLTQKQDGELKIKLFGGFDKVRLKNLFYM
jgi:hypothetical protein